MRRALIILGSLVVASAAHATDIWSTDGNVTVITNDFSSNPFASGFDFTQADSGSAAQVLGGLAGGWINPPLLGDPHNAQWIGYSSSDYAGGYTEAFSDAFSVSSNGHYTMNIMLSADDQIGDSNGNAGLFIDGKALTPSNSPILWDNTIFTGSYDLGNLSAGTHHIEFNVWNSGAGPSGLVYTGSVQSVPEPMSLSFLGLGALGLFRKKRA